MGRITTLKEICISALTMLLLANLTHCTPIKSEIAIPKETASSTAQSTSGSSITPIMLATWNFGHVFDIAWSPSSEKLVINSQEMANEPNRIHAIEVSSLQSLWVAENDPSVDLAFSQDGRFIVASNPLIGSLYLRSPEQGSVARQIQDPNCPGGQFILPNSIGNTFLVADTNGITGLNPSNEVYIMQWNLDSNSCQNVISYSGSFHLLDVNTTGTLIAYGGQGRGDEIVIWSEEKQAEVCRIKADFGRFVPHKDILAVFRDQRVTFVDALSCQELWKFNAMQTFKNYLDFSPAGEQFAIAEKSIMIINTNTGEVTAQIPLPENTAPAFYTRRGGLLFSPNGQYLILVVSTYASDYSDVVQLWHLSR